MDSLPQRLWESPFLFLRPAFLKQLLFYLLSNSVVLNPCYYKSKKNLQRREVMFQQIQMTIILLSPTSIACKSTLYKLTFAYGLPTWFSGKESVCQCRGRGFDPWSGKFPHAMEQLSLCTSTAEPVRPGAHAPQKRSHCDAKPLHCN